MCRVAGIVKPSSSSLPPRFPTTFSSSSSSSSLAQKLHAGPLSLSFAQKKETTNQEMGKSCLASLSAAAAAGEEGKEEKSFGGARAALSVEAAAAA